MSGIGNASKEDKRPFSSRARLGRKLSASHLPSNTPDRSFTEKTKVASWEEKQRFKSCFPPLLQSTGTIGAALSPKASSNSLANCSEIQSSRFQRKQCAVVPCMSLQLTKNEFAGQWLEKDAVKNERGKARANTSARRQYSGQKTTNSSEKSYSRSQSPPENGPIGQKAIPNPPRTVGLRSKSSVEYPSPRSATSTDRHRLLARESLAQNAFPSPAAVSYNFALDTYHPLASRQGCKQPAFPYKTSTRVRPSSMKRDKNGWVHSRKFAEAIVSSESSHSKNAAPSCSTTTGSSKRQEAM